MGIQILRDFQAMSDRYAYDFGKCTYEKGWAQVDTSQDASYFGTWANPERRQIFNYCEGDLCLTSCDTDEDFVKAIRETADWNKERGYWLGIDAMTTPVLLEKFHALGLGDLLH